MLGKTIKAWPVALLMATTALSLAAPQAALAQSETTAENFYQALAEHGYWRQHPRHGWVWTPANVDNEWRPYSDGRWVWTEEHGWYWVTNEPFGWAVYHYGRWSQDEDFGWYWVPGRVWGPGWVMWRQGEDEIGWMPLPPEYSFASAPAYDSPYYEAFGEPRYRSRWMFVRAQHFLAPSIRVVLLGRGLTAGLFGRTRHATQYVTWRGTVMNRSFGRERIERATNRPIAPVRVVAVANARHAGTGLNPRAGGQATIQAYRPVVRATPAGAAPPAFAIRTAPSGNRSVRSDGVPGGTPGTGRIGPPPPGNSGPANPGRAVVPAAPNPNHAGPPPNPSNNAAFRRNANPYAAPPGNPPAVPNHVYAQPVPPKTGVTLPPGPPTARYSPPQPPVGRSGPPPQPAPFVRNNPPPTPPVARSNPPPQPAPFVRNNPPPTPPQPPVARYNPPPQPAPFVRNNPPPAPLMRHNPPPAPAPVVRHNPPPQPAARPAPPPPPAAAKAPPPAAQPAKAPPPSHAGCGRPGLPACPPR